MDVADSLDEDDEDDCMEIKLTEAYLHAYEASQKNHREELHGLTAIAAGRTKIFGDEQCNWSIGSNAIDIAQGVDYINFQNWQAKMTEDITGLDINNLSTGCHTSNPGKVTTLTSEQIISELHEDHHGVEPMSMMMQPKVLEHITAIDPSQLLKDQRRAYDIIDWHLAETLARQAPPQLLMIIPGEGGVGKSKTIQTITENFRDRGVADILVKAAYTGIAASIIDGKTLHVIAQIPVNDCGQSQKASRKLAAFWNDKMYLIINKSSMMSRTFFARLLAYIAKGKSLAGKKDTNKPFRGVNVIIVGEFHQFPPIAGGKNAPLFWPCNTSKDNAEELLGQKLYEEFRVVVRLKEQVRVTDPDWLDLLQHVRHGSCRAHHIKFPSLVITNPDCPSVDFMVPPWNKAVLVTPRHSVHQH